MKNITINKSASNKYKYWAFISYSSKDEVIAKQLQKRLENFIIPDAILSSFEKSHPLESKKVRPVFRDRDELRSGNSVRDELHRHLEQSDYLIVICSPNSAYSQWVEEEIQYFKDIGKTDHILAVIANGTPNATSDTNVDSSLECFPPSLRTPHEPLAADLRKSGDGKTRAPLKLLATILDTEFDALYTRFLRQQKQRRLTTAILSILGIIALSFLGNKVWKADSKVMAAKSEARKSEVVAQKQSAINERLKQSFTTTDEATNNIVFAIIDENLSTLDKLIQTKEQANKPLNSKGITPIALAAMSGSTKSIELLYQKGADPYQPMEHGISAIHYAAQSNQSESLATFKKLKLNINQPAVNGRGRIKPRPIDWAASSGAIDAVTFFLNNEIPIEEDKSSALAWAVAHPETFKLLIDKGADINFKHSALPDTLPVKPIFEQVSAITNEKAYDLIASKLIKDPQKRLNRKLFDQFKGPSPTVDKIKQLLENGANINTKHSQSRLAEKREYSIFRMLITGAITRNVRRSDELNLLTQMFLDYGADPNTTIVDHYDPEENTNVLWECVSNNIFTPETIEKLLEKGANPNLQAGQFFETPLAILCSRYYQNTPKQIPSAKMKKLRESINSSYKTAGIEILPLDLKRKRTIAVVKLLLKYGAKDTYQHRGKTINLKYVAKEKGMPEIYQLLVNKFPTK